MTYYCRNCHKNIQPEEVEEITGGTGYNHPRCGNGIIVYRGVNIIYPQPQEKKNQAKI